MNNDTNNIAQNITNSSVQGGIQAAIGNQNKQTVQTNANSASDPPLSMADVLQIISRIESEIQHSGLSEEVQAKASKYLDAAKTEVQEDEPDKSLAAANLKRMAETIETTSQTVESGKKIWANIKPALEQLAPWLGIAAKFFVF